MEFKIHEAIKSNCFFAVTAILFLGYALYYRGGLFYEIGTLLLQSPHLLSVFISGICGIIIYMQFRSEDYSLIALLLIAEYSYLFSGKSTGIGAEAITLLTAITLGKSIRFAIVESGHRYLAFGIVMLIGLTCLPFGNGSNYYHGPRWTGPWYDPNIYGMLMGTGFVLVIGMLIVLRDGRGCAGDKSISVNSSFSNAVSLWKFCRKPNCKHCCVKPFSSIVFGMIAIMMSIGLLFSYSRGSWLGSFVGVLYLTYSYGKFNWKVILPGIIVLLVTLLLFWHATPDACPWYLKRLDLSRPSVSHRIIAWNGAVQLIIDHPLGVGWNRAVHLYETHYSAPYDGAVAILTNAYLTLGAELGIPGLIFFLFTIWNSLRGRENDGVIIACRASVAALLVMFWFDGGLFELSTACIFWVLLELGSGANVKKCGGRLIGVQPAR
jgi:hypothetical protein